MKETILQDLTRARHAMGKVFVCEKENCINQGSAMELVEKVIKTLATCEIVSVPLDRPESKEVTHGSAS